MGCRGTSGPAVSPAPAPSKDHVGLTTASGLGGLPPIDGYYGGLYVSPVRDGEAWIVDGQDYFPATAETVPGGVRLSPMGSDPRPPVWLRRDGESLCLAGAIDAPCEAPRDDDPLARLLRSGPVTFDRLDERRFERTGEIVGLADEQARIHDGLELSLSLRSSGKIEPSSGVIVRRPDDPQHPRRRLYTSLAQGVTRGPDGHPLRSVHHLSDHLADFYLHVDDAGQPVLLELSGYMFVAFYVPHPLPADLGPIRDALLR